MTKLLLAATMALGLGMGVASAATTTNANHPNWPSVTQYGPPASSPSYGAGNSY
ncbi:MAG TPA: hypothetical protein VMF03_21775 [Steroidobacteraceae bacterium]|nr:hypothetical protein [Steroidobacteraceae bacterium]